MVGWCNAVGQFFAGSSLVVGLLPAATPPAPEASVKRYTYQVHVHRQRRPRPGRRPGAAHPTRRRGACGRHCLGAYWHLRVQLKASPPVPSSLQAETLTHLRRPQRHGQDPNVDADDIAQPLNPTGAPTAFRQGSETPAIVAAERQGRHQARLALRHLRRSHLELRRRPSPPAPACKWSTAAAGAPTRTITRFRHLPPSTPKVNPGAPTTTCSSTSPATSRPADPDLSTSLRRPSSSWEKLLSAPELQLSRRVPAVIPY